jgi:predicted ester cyclase
MHHFNQDVWNQGNLELIDEVVAADYIGHTPDGELHGPQGFRAYVTLTRTQYPDLRLTSEIVAADGEIVVSRWSARGTYHGGDASLPDSVIGKEMTLPGVSIERLAGGKLVESWETWDRLGVLQQFGLL